VSRVVVDTGPLVALLNRRDKFHAWSREVFGAIEPPLYTCEAVVSEACFLLGRLDGGIEALMTLLSIGALRIDFSLAAEADAIRALLHKYAAVPMAPADACLLRMVELESDSVLVTLDSGFRVYRRNRRQVIPAILPDRAGR
jgi:uncharacterized protein